MLLAPTGICMPTPSMGMPAIFMLSTMAKAGFAWRVTLDAESLLVEAAQRVPGARRLERLVDVPSPRIRRKDVGAKRIPPSSCPSFIDEIHATALPLNGCRLVMWFVMAARTFAAWFRRNQSGKLRVHTSRVP